MTKTIIITVLSLILSNYFFQYIGKEDYAEAFFRSYWCVSTGLAIWINHRLFSRHAPNN